LRAKLPAYMIPARIVQIDSIPLLTSGKTDYKKLLELAGSELEVTFTTENGMEQKIIEIWQNILNTKSIHPNDNFFDIGGHSLLLVKVKSEIFKHFNKEINLLDLFKYPTIFSLAQYLSGKDVNEADKRKESIELTENSSNDIAVIGMSCRFPGADDPDEFWDNLLNGVDSVTAFSKEELLQSGVSEHLIDDEDYVPSAGIISDIDKVDAEFFGFSPMEASLLDPQQRVLLECAYRALENSGYTSLKFKGKIGVFTGVGFSTYLVENLLPNKKLINSTGIFPIQIANGNDFCSTRIAYKLNLNGPAISVNTACSTSLTATHLAVNSLLNGDCEIALAGGASIRSTQKEGYLYEDGNILSRDGKCRAFDKDAGGTVGGSGAGIVVLKKLRAAEGDNDNILAVIKGTGINNDGKNKIGFTAPGIEGQSNVIKEAQRKAGVSSDSITYVETHGTGTILGDPIEVSALKEAFKCNQTRENCYIGSVKSNIGHLDAAAGVAGIIKTVLALKNKTIPKSLHFTSPNPKLEIEDSCFKVAETKIKWDTNQLPRMSGVSSFGIGGTNVHVVLEEYNTKENLQSVSKAVLIPLSAKKNEAVIAQTDQLIDFIQNNDKISLIDLSYSLSARRAEYQFRKCVFGNSTSKILDQLKSGKEPVSSLKPGKIVFMFTGQGAQYLEMARGLYDNFSFFADIMDRCSTILSDLAGFDIRDIIWSNKFSSQLINSTQYTQPALFIIEFALAKLLIKFGINPDELIGHSIGEITSAAISEVFSLEDAITLIFWRSRLMEAQPRGSMLAISLPEFETKKHLGNDLSIAVINSKKQTVVSGNTESIKILNEKLTKQKIRSSIIQTSHAFHSHMMDGMLEPFKKKIENIEFHDPKIPFISNVTGKVITNKQAKSPQYWAEQIRNTVRFDEGISELLTSENSCFIEVGPASVLSNLTKQNSLRNHSQHVFALQQRNQSAVHQYQDFLSTLAKLWENGVDIDWRIFFEGTNAKIISLPTYPFQRKKFWIDKIRNNTNEFEDKLEIEFPEKDQPPSSEELTVSEEIARNTFKEILGIDNFSKNDDFFTLGGDSLMASSLISLLKRKYQIKLRVTDLMQNPSVSALSTLISAPAQKTKLPECLIKLSQGDEKLSPIFLIHAIGGGALIYNDLLKNLKLRNPIYGIKAVGLWDKKTPLQSVQKQAEYYLEAINETYKDKQIHLAGCSYGGLIAFEISKMMKSGTVLSTVMFDSPGPGYLPKALNNDDEIFAYMLDQDNDNRKFSDYLAELSKIPQQNKQDFTFGIIKKWSGFNNMKQSDFCDQVNVLKANLNAMNQYKTDAFDGKIHFFKAMESDELNALTPELAWIPLAVGGIEIIPCGGNHISMLSEPHVKKLAVNFSNILKGK